MRWLLELLRVLLFPRHRPKGMVRPWALSAPVLVLILALPLLRPVRHPDPRQISDDEMALLATTQAWVEHETLSIDATDFKNTRTRVVVVDAGGVARSYAAQPPTMGVLLAISYRVMRYYGLTFARDGPTVAYLLTLLGVTLPAACAAGLIYRMGRLFELPRPKRALLAAVCVIASGLFTYATVLNVHVPAATLILASATCLIHLSIAQRKPITPIWLCCAGFCAALAAVIDPSSIAFAPTLAGVVLVYRWSWLQRIGGLLLFVAGAVGPLALHTTFVWRGSGELYHGMNFTAPPRTYDDADDTDVLDDPDEPGAFWKPIGRALGTAGYLFFGGHGLLSHFPVLAIGVLGVTMIMHRHWPQAAKVLAAGTLAAAVYLMVAYTIHRRPGRAWADWMFAAKWFVVFAPMVLFWSGAWLRKAHRTGSWVVVGVLLAFSLAVGIIGATYPQPRQGYNGYTAYLAVRQLWQGDTQQADSPALPSTRPFPIANPDLPGAADRLAP
ncbi:hypothetical protein [Humisphaera borealis]|uniref:Uncharacterized protein n=1 Tax=Humisphaera borealis TaxID=2807512 RepID=A0A7M2WR91_9BACT|nr:hypothetical protein [Humisphaera borealis]QOV88028.1 hypothetical protein IPV69_17380 [Humisphaera borealis]